MLNINILDHPTNRNISVFFYTESIHSDYFKELLKSNSITYEFQVDESDGKFYFGVDKRDFKTARKLNFLVFAKFRKPFIAYAPARYLLVILTLIFIILAFVGYLKQ